MARNEEFKLIEGEFNPEEAKDLLLNIIGNKIQFHTTRNFSSQICLGRSDKNLLDRLNTLRESREKIINVLDEASKNNLLVEIQSSVVISYRIRK